MNMTIAKAKPISATEQFEESRRLSGEGRGEAAIIAGLRSLDSKTDRKAHYEHLARVLVDAGMPRGAELVVRHGIELGFGRPVMYSLLGRVLFKQQRYEEALAAMDQAIERGPGQEGYVRYREMIAGKIAKRDGVPAEAADDGE